MKSILLIQFNFIVYIYSVLFYLDNAIFILSYSISKEQSICIKYNCILFTFILFCFSSTFYIIKPNCFHFFLTLFDCIITYFYFISFLEVLSTAEYFLSFKLIYSLVFCLANFILLHSIRVIIFIEQSSFNLKQYVCFDTV